MDLNSYYCYEEDILAPADGMIVKIYNHQKDSSIMKNNETDPLVKNLAGNYIIIKHEDNEYSFFGHLKPHSIVVKENEKVKRGQKIALCGNSGNTTEPHFHFQIQNKESFIFSSGIPICFENLQIAETVNHSQYDDRVLPEEKTHRDRCQYIHRGQTVSNN
ncbi:M23 family metallopeptidase [Peptoniphilus equinus]|uniref:M23 family metallopeptidase n=1 Tax=Peptoniphilus equinus TaxID=3016343 RepID=A0ABY7QTW2_9FIRM|nr:M23 family metallopeptidase [Peptoniphilus equinus]WBW49598.1 M23 family metallopeptidase [Peptoniphilus equinus]